MGRVSQSLADNPGASRAERAALEYGAFETGQLQSYVEIFRNVFLRAEQVRWFEVYLRGLLMTPGRKSVEAVARFLSA